MDKLLMTRPDRHQFGSVSLSAALEMLENSGQNATRQTEKQIHGQHFVFGSFSEFLYMFDFVIMWCRKSETRLAQFHPYNAQIHITKDTTGLASAVNIAHQQAIGETPKSSESQKSNWAEAKRPNRHDIYFLCCSARAQKECCHTLQCHNKPLRCTTLPSLALASQFGSPTGLKSVRRCGARPNLDNSARSAEK